MKTIKIKFVDFWSGYIPQERSIYQCLIKKYNVIISNNPDYLFYGCFGYEHLNYKCIKIFVATECIHPDFNICDYALGYSRFEYGDRYLYYPGIYEVGYKTSCEQMLLKEKITLNTLKSRTGFCAMVVSNGLNSDPMRERLFDKLSEYKKVASGGRYRNNVGGPVLDKNEFQRHYKFSIAAENMSSPGYVTEKIIESFAAGTIPIYWGDPEVGKIYNEAAFVNCHKYRNLEEVLAEVQRIDNDDEIYIKMANECPVVDSAIWNYNARQIVLLDFLSNIFDQEISKAKRISHEGANKLYLERMKNWRDAYKFSYVRLKNRIKSIKYRKYRH